MANNRQSCIAVYQRDEEDSFFLKSGRLRLGETANFVRGSSLEIFQGTEKIDAKRFQEAVLTEVENAGGTTGIYRVDRDAETLSVLSPDQGCWQTYSINDVLAAANNTEALLEDLLKTCPLNSEPETVQLRSSHPLADGDFILCDTIDEIDNLLNFYLQVECDVTELFGTHLENSESGGHLVFFANYDLESGQVIDRLDITLCRSDGEDIPLCYRLTDSERNLLLTKMQSFCQYCGTPLEEWRREYLAEHSQTAAPSATMEQSM